MTKSKLISVVIAIKDWEAERLDLAIRSHRTCTVHERVEIVVSDFGSSCTADTRAVCETHGCKYIYTDSDVWSRSRALNVALSECTADLMVTTDADIIFAPRTLEVTSDLLSAYPRALVLSQCSDISKELPLEELADLPWEKIQKDSTLRPRWGMGGLCAFTRDTLEIVRGFEERMTVWGAEDNDFVKRCRQAGRFLHWITGSGVGIYHVWHPPFLQTDPEAEAIFADNKKILNNEFTTARNYTRDVLFKAKTPLVSIHIAAYNRGHLIGDAIDSVLNQTVQDFELLVYDDGSVDNTREIVTSFADKRIRYITDGKNGGVANARNRMLDEAKGHFVCVHDDDDIMLPNRLEIQLNALSDGYAGCYGGWIDYDANDGMLTHHSGKTPFGVPSTAFVGSVFLHPTLMIKTDVMRRLRYETSFRGGSDFNLAFRMANAGYKLNHCRDFVILRRVHRESLTGKSQDKQKMSARITVAPFLNNLSKQVEAVLRHESNKVKPVIITPYYDDVKLSEFMPKEYFDELVEITNIEEKVGKRIVRIFSPKTPQRSYAVLTRNSKLPLRLKGLDRSEFCRVPRLHLDGKCPESLNKDFRAITKMLCIRNGIEHSGNKFVLNCPTKIVGNIQNVVDEHSHIINSLALFIWDDKTYLTVDGPTAEVSMFALLNSVSMLRSSPSRVRSVGCNINAVTLEA